MNGRGLPALLARASVEVSSAVFEDKSIRVTSSAGVSGLDDCGDKLDKATLLGIADGLQLLRNERDHGTLVRACVHGR